MRPELPVLIKARALIADPAKWGKGRRRLDRPLDTCCAAEALETAESSLGRRRCALRALERAAGIEPNDTCVWNDHPDTTHAEVLAAFDKAIEAST